MMKSYVSKTTINYEAFKFYVRPGDLLVHDTSNQNKLTVYRNGQIVKVVKQDPLGIVAFLRNKFIEEVPVALVAVPVAMEVVSTPEPVATPVTTPVVAIVEPRKGGSKKEKAPVVEPVADLVVEIEPETKEAALEPSIVE